MARTTTSKEDAEMASELNDLLDITFAIDAGKVLDFVRVNYRPEDVFDDGALEIWAKENDYVLSQEP